MTTASSDDHLDLDRLAGEASANLSGDAEAFRRLAHAVSPRVHALAWRILADSQLAGDAVQEFLIRLLKVLPAYDGGRPFWPWAKRIATRLAIDLARREKSWLNAPLEAVPDAPAPARERPDRLHETAAATERIRAASLQLTGRQRTIFVLRDLEEWTTAEIAEHLDMAESTVRVHLARARMRLREALNPGEES